MRVIIFGGGGFIGRHLCAELARRGHEMILPVRNRERVKEDIILLPRADVFAYHPTVSATVLKALPGADVAVNLVGILNEPKRNMFDQVHGEFVRMLVEGCEMHKVPRFVQISSIGAADAAPSAYLRSKAKGEQIVRASGALRHAIIRLSTVFGEGDSFINRFASLLRLAPVMPLPGADARMQPVAVEDAVALIAKAIENESLENTTWHAGGPEVLTLREIVARVADAMRLRRAVVPLGPALSYAMAAVMEAAPFVDLLTRDNCRSMRVPSVCPKNGNDAALQLGALTDLNTGLARMFSAKNTLHHLRLSARR